MSENLTGYEDEPRVHFGELPPDLYRRLYHYERLSHDLDAELNYYHAALQDSCTRVLELGCGTGLLSSGLERLGYYVTGMDRDRGALNQAADTQRGRLVQMDMRALGFQPRFEAVLVAQNTLNLLVEPMTIKNCLRQIHDVLVDSGLLLAHLYCTEAEQRKQPAERLLQFVVFDHPEGGKIIKETIRAYDPEKTRLKLEQRYKIRRFDEEMSDHNYRHVLSLAALSRDEWVELMHDAGFSVESWSHGFQDGAPSSPSTLHLVARKKPFPQPAFK